jgi:RNA polymerase sigma factor (sigma-70 family)
MTPLVQPAWLLDAPVGATSAAPVDVDVDADTDADLVRLMAARDETALAALYARHAPALLGFLIATTGNRADAEEVLQDTFFAAWHSAARFRGDSRVRTWLLAIARRQIGARRRRRGLTAAPLGPDDDWPDTAAGPEDVALTRAGAVEVAAQVSRLSDYQKSILSLAFVQELSYHEMAKVLDIPIGTVKSRLNSARRALATLLTRTGEQGG